MVPRSSLKLNINVEIVDTLQNLHLAHYTDIVGNDEFRIIKVDNATTQDTIKVLTLELLSEYIDEKDLILSKNYYSVLSDYFIEVEKFVKAETDTKYKKSTKMNEKESVSYRLDI